MTQSMISLLVLFGAATAASSSEAAASDSGCQVHQSAKYSKAEAERYIKAGEAEWAASVATSDASVLKRILADDFVWVLDDRVLDKATAAGLSPGRDINDRSWRVAAVRPDPKSRGIADVRNRRVGWIAAIACTMPKPLPHPKAWLLQLDAGEQHEARRLRAVGGVQRRGQVVFADEPADVDREVAWQEHGVEVAQAELGDVEAAAVQAGWSARRRTARPCRRSPRGRTRCGGPGRRRIRAGRRRSSGPGRFSSRPQAKVVCQFAVRERPVVGRRSRGAVLVRRSASAARG